MERKQIIKDVKCIIAEYFEDADCGLFFTRNFVGDPMGNIYMCEGVSVDMCFEYSYFEVFGLTKEEQWELMEFYNDLKKKHYKGSDTE